MPPKKSTKAFTSFRVIGKKAQDLLIRASQEIQKKNAKTNGASAALPPEAQEQPRLLVDFSLGSIAKSTLTILGIVVGAWALYQLMDKILLLILGLFVAAIIDPTVRSMEKWGIPRGIAILLHYFGLVLIVVFLLVSLIPIVAQQMQNIAVLLTNYVNAFRADPTLAIPLIGPDVNARLTDLLRTLLDNLSIGQFATSLQTWGQNMSSVASSWVLFATRVAGSVVGFFVKLIIVLVLAFFIQIEKERIRLWFSSFFSHRYRSYIDDKTVAVHLKIAQWARGQMLLAFSIGMLVFVALNILGMTEYAATLAVLAAMTEFVPYIGPFIAAVPSVIIALSEGGFMWAAIVAGVYYIIQWCENNLLVPLIMKRAVGISPIAVMFAMLVGVSFPDIIHPILGLLLAVPTATIIVIFLEDWRQMRQNKR
jgi:predicted PurR-regulated permease PerM